MSDLVGNPEDRFSRVAAHISTRFIDFHKNKKQLMSLIIILYLTKTDSVTYLTVMHVVF